MFFIKFEIFLVLTVMIDFFIENYIVGGKHVVKVWILIKYFVLAGCFSYYGRGR